MSQLIVALYESFDLAEAAVRQLTRDQQLNSDDVSLLTYESQREASGSDTGSETFLARELGARRDIGAVRDSLVKFGVDDDDAQQFAEGLRRGSTLVAVQAPESKINEIHSTLRSHGPIDITERAESWRQAGWSGLQADARQYTAEEAAAERQSYAKPATAAKAGTEQVLPVMEEKLVVGKREVEHGGVRVYTRVTETPVEETVNLREEHVRVERRPADRPVEPGQLNAFEEGTIEMTERAEEAVITKQARVIEEVVIRKDVEQRTETVHDTVRRTDVEVEDTRHGATPQGQASAQSDYGLYENDFRAHYNAQFANSGYTYEQYAPAYRFGRLLRTHERYRDADWATVEPQARRMWDERNPGTWENFKNSIRYAWERIAKDKSTTGPA